MFKVVMINPKYEFYIVFVIKNFQKLKSQSS